MVSIKKRIVAMFAAAAMAVSLLPVTSFAAETSDPILRYTFDGTDPLADENGKNTLTLSGGASVGADGNVGNALHLDGVDGYALLPSDILSDSMTVTTWVKISKFTTWGRVFDFGTDSSNNFFLAPYSGGAARIEMKSPSGTSTMDTVQETEREWVHYAVTVDNGTVSYYRNGSLLQSKSGVGSVEAIKDELNYIGKSHYDGDAYLAASIDDFRIYDCALDRNDICNIMADGEISADMLFKSYAIEDGQLITGDTIDLPKLGALTWYENDNLGLIDVETGAVKHTEKTETVILTAAIGDDTRNYTVYVTGTDETPYSIAIDASDRSKDVSDIMWGLFFEDINSAADDGLYAEMVQNRSFEMDDPLYSWETYKDVKVNTENPLNENNPTYVTLGYGALITNDGFQGLNIKKGKYKFKMYVRGDAHLHNHVYINSNELEESIEVYFDEIPDDIKKGKWGEITGNLVVDEDINNAKLVISAWGDTTDIDMVSLIPEDTYKGHGLRKDLMEALEAMHPKFLRFPGGCAVEGRTMDEAWNWKDTIGDVSERKEMINIWDTDGTYKMTYGLGFYEYFQMCEDLGMEPVPILNCGIACQVRSGSAEDEAHLVPMDKLQPYIDDALDLIAFANGTDESNEWTKLRIDMGHPEPFNMKYIGIGNEQYGEIYWERYAEFAKQIHEKYPEINLVTTSGTASSGTGNDLAWNWANANTELADRMDEHYYENADWFRTHAYRYDNYRRDTNTKVFLGEYASKGNTWYNALSEAAFMTGLERNADIVRMASYAPMFAKYGNVQWSAANMIWFNNDDYVLTPNYYVQSLFSNNKGDYSLQTSVSSMSKNETLRGGVVVGSWGTHNEFKDVTVNITGGNSYAIGKDEWNIGNGEWTVNEDGSLVQTGDATGSTAWVDIPNARNYTVTLKAKKTAGGEGFQIGVAAEDGQNYYRVNIGGWGNTTAKVQRIVNGVSAEAGNVAEQSYVGNVHINDNEWYDVRVEMSDYEIKAYLNDEFICSYIKPQEYGPVYASSVYDEKSGEVIVKVVNTLNGDVDVRLNVINAAIESDADMIVMSGDTSLENTLENKNAIAPVEGKITNAGNSFVYSAPADSFSIIKLKASEAHKPYISGYTDGTFRPDNTITRAEAAAMICRAGGTGPIGGMDFADVPPSFWAAGYIGAMGRNGCITGYPDGKFKPDSPVTRAEFCVMLGKYLGIDISKSETQFEDVAANHYAAGYITELRWLNIIAGYEDGTFKPNNTITRAEAVTMMNKALHRNENKTSVTDPFSDVPSNHWAYQDILRAI